MPKFADFLLNQAHRASAYHQDGLRQRNTQKRSWRAINAGIAATLEGHIKPEELLTHCFALEQLDSAFQMMVDRPDGFIKGWITL